MGKKNKKNKNNFYYELIGAVISTLFIAFLLLSIRPDYRLSDIYRDLAIELNSTSKK